MDDRTALIAAIRANPDDDLPHLVYADWLEETGDIPAMARAELIRVQCGLRRRPKGEERDRLEAVEKRQLARFGWAWMPSPGLILFSRRIDRGLTFYRLDGSTTPGFIDRVADYCHALPPETCLDIEIRPSAQTRFARLRAAPFADWITSLSLDLCRIEAVPRALLAEALVNQLTTQVWPRPLNQLELRGVIPKRDAARLAAHYPPGVVEDRTA